MVLAYGPWKAPGVRRVPRDSFPELRNSYATGYSMNVAIGAAPTSTVPLDTPTTAHVTTFNGTGSAASQAVERLGTDQYSVDLGVWLADLTRWTDPTHAANILPPWFDTTDPDYIRGDWVSTDVEAPGTGVLLTDHSVDIDIEGDDLNNPGLDCLVLTEGTDYVMADLLSDVTLHLPAASASRWSTATSAALASGVYRTTITMPFSLHYAVMFRTSGVWTVHSSDLTGGVTLFQRATSITTAAYAYYQPPRYRFVYDQPADLVSVAVARPVASFQPAIPVRAGSDI